MNTLQKTSEAILKTSVATTGLLSTFYTIVDLMFFLSDPNYFRTTMKNGNPTDTKWSWSLIINILLLSMFALQHTVLALPQVKELFAKYRLKDVQRSVYIICTCIGLEFLIKNWHYTTTNTLWEFSLDNRSVYWLYTIAHILSWILIYIGSICMDINELLGIKQVYYALQQLPEPLTFKTFELQTLYSHMRHPSFIGFVIIFWFVPVMRLDRLLLAAFLSLYMYIAWQTDDTDLHYQKNQFAKKFH